MNRDGLASIGRCARKAMVFYFQERSRASTDETLLALSAGFAFNRQSRDPPRGSAVREFSGQEAISRQKWCELMILGSAVEAESACRCDRLKAPSLSRGSRSSLRGAEASTAESRTKRDVGILPSEVV